jgi:hypothetical protein
MVRAEDLQPYIFSELVAALYSPQLSSSWAIKCREAVVLDLGDRCQNLSGSFPPIANARISPFDTPPERSASHHLAIL